MIDKKDMIIQIDETDRRLYISNVLLNATLCLYDIRGKVVEIKQADASELCFELPCRGEYILVVTHALTVPVVKQFLIK